MDDFPQSAPAEPIAIADAPVTDIGAPEPPSPVSDGPKRTRMEAIERAFNALDKPDDSAEAEGRARGADGKFIAKEVPQDASQEAPTDKPAIGDAPARFSPDAKAAWASAPEAVRGEINRAITEMERGLAEKDQKLAPLKPFFDMGAQHGVQVHEALGKYVAMEQLLAKDIGQGLAAIAQNFGMTLPDMLAKVSGQPSQSTDKDREILTLRQEIQAIRGEFGQVSQTVQQQREAAIMSDVQRFAESRPRFDELAPEITRLLQTGYASDLQDAYQKAERLNPGPQIAAPAAPMAAVQPRQPRSVTGSPASGSDPTFSKPSATRAEALSRAFSRVGLT